jgi:CDP-diacylglycerol pyrophosphatase
MLGRLLVATAIIVALSGVGIGWAGADSDALWTIVHDRCVPHERLNDDPAPCALVDLGGGDDRGFAVLKDIDGATQFLLIPTERVTGIESPAVLEPGAPNYFAAAWRARFLVEERAARSLPRDCVSLAVNSELARSQNQLHIHIDCLRADVHEALMLHGADIGSAWTPFPVLLAGDRYSVIAVAGEDLDAVNPFDLLADGLPGARAAMGRNTLVVVGAVLDDGRPGFIVLAGHADPAVGDLGGGEELQDHQSCAAPAAGK